MATIVTGTVPASEFALEDTLSRISDVRIVCERVVESGGDVVMPLTWIRTDDPETLSAALDDDPTVEDVSLLAAFGDEYLYRMSWIDRVQLVVDMITNVRATVLKAHGTDGSWTLQVMYPARDDISKTREFCADHGLTFDVRGIEQMNEEPAGRYGLTEEQYEALRVACDQGYFAVPRETGLGTLAEELGISHQALSERLRRGEDALIASTVRVDAGPDDE